MTFDIIILFLKFFGIIGIGCGIIKWIYDADKKARREDMKAELEKNGYNNCFEYKRIHKWTSCYHCENEDCDFAGIPPNNNEKIKKN